jgi:MFS family permease
VQAPGFKLFLPREVAMRLFNARKIMLALFLAIFLLKAFYLGEIPLQFDGTLYAVMIAEEAEGITFLPTYLGWCVPWKPGLYFITYSLFLPITSQLFDSIEWIYKSPNLLFGIINAFVFYLISKRFLKPDVALAATLLFYSAYGVIYAETRLLMEVFALTPILISLLFYTDKKMGAEKRFLLAGVFALAAALTKSVIAFMLIPLALAYMLQEDRKSLNNPYFLLSLLAPFIGILLFYLALESVGLSEAVLLRDTGKFFVHNDILQLLERLYIGFLFFLVLYAAYIFVSFRKMLSSWREQLFFSAWLVLSLVPVMEGSPIPWHTYYVAPALAFFAALSLSHKGKMDSFSVFMVVLLVAINIAMPFFAEFEFTDKQTLLDARQAGLEFSGKEDALIIGAYSTSSTVSTYKILSERQETGAYLDFGCVFMNWRAEEGPPEGYLEGILNAVVRNYTTQEYVFLEGEYALMFETNLPLRKPTNITEFEHVIVSPPDITLSDPGYELTWNSTSIAAYAKSGEP